MKAKTKFEIVAVGIIVVAIGYIAFNSFTLKVEARRDVLIDGDLYTISSVSSPERITQSKDLKVFFDKKNNKLLIGKELNLAEPESDDHTTARLFLINRDGTGEKKISNKSIRYAAFDPNNENLIYFSTENSEIFQYDNIKEKEDFLVNGADGFHFSPDSQSLVYLKAPEGWQMGDISLGLTVLDVATKKERLLTFPPGYPMKASNDYAPYWTPDGKYILFFNDGLYMVNADGKNRTQLTKLGDGTEATGLSGSPIFSKDGKYFIIPADYEIIVVELDLKNRKVITAGPIAYGKDPKWIEEGKTISVIKPIYYNKEALNFNSDIFSIVDLNGKVISGDKSHEKEYYSPLKGAFRRVAPKPVPPPLPPESPREIPPGVFHSINNTQSPDIPKEIPTGALKPVAQ